jgi:UDP-glucose 4-epimerase
VNGESTLLDRPFLADDQPRPTDAYAVSKHEAEEGLRQIGKETGLEVVIIRPVLVYGPGVRANFLSMMRWLDHGLPLPLGAIRNARSLVALDNLVDLVATCLHHPAAVDQSFLVSDGDDLSTPELLRRTAAAMGRPARLIPVPEIVLRSAATIVGKANVAERLCGSLRVDIEKTRRLLGWTPPTTVDQALRKTVRYFLDDKVPR